MDVLHSNNPIQLQNGVDNCKINLNSCHACAAHHTIQIDLKSRYLLISLGSFLLRII